MFFTFTIRNKTVRKIVSTHIEIMNFLKDTYKDHAGRKKVVVIDKSLYKVENGRLYIESEELQMICNENKKGPN